MEKRKNKERTVFEKVKTWTALFFSGFKVFLETNKIFFETVAATALSIMAVLLSVNGNSIANKQSQLLTRQMLIEEKRLEREQRMEQYQNTSDWTALRDVLWNILDLNPGTGFEDMKNFPLEFFVQYFHQFKILLDSQSSNPILINDQESLKNWREAIGSVKASQNILKKLVSNSNKNLNEEMKEALIGSLTIANSKVVNVWAKLILNSNEVAAIG